MSGTIPIYLALESPKFREQCGPLSPGSQALRSPSKDASLGFVDADAQAGDEAAKDTMSLRNLNRETRQFTAEGFLQYALLLPDAYAEDTTARRPADPRPGDLPPRVDAQRLLSRVESGSRFGHDMLDGRELGIGLSGPRPSLRQLTS